MLALLIRATNCECFEVLDRWILLCEGLTHYIICLSCLSQFPIRFRLKSHLIELFDWCLQYFECLLIKNLALACFQLGGDNPCNSCLLRLLVFSLFGWAICWYTSRMILVRGLQEWGKSLHEFTKFVFLCKPKFTLGTLMGEGLNHGSTFSWSWTIFMLDTVDITTSPLTQTVVISLIIFCFEWTRVQNKATSSSFIIFVWRAFNRGSTLLTLFHSLILFNCCGEVTRTSAKNMTDCVDLLWEYLFLSLQRRCNSSTCLNLFNIPASFSSRAFLRHRLWDWRTTDNYKTCFLSWGLICWRRYNRCSWVKHSLRGGKGTMKFLKWVPPWSMGMSCQVFNRRMMLKTTTQHSWCSWSLYNCSFLLLSHRGLSWWLLWSLILIGRDLDINLIEINLWNILQPPLLQCGIDFLHTLRIDLGVIWVWILLVDSNSGL